MRRVFKTIDDARDYHENDVARRVGNNNIDFEWSGFVTTKWAKRRRDAGARVFNIEMWAYDANERERKYCRDVLILNT